MHPSGFNEVVLLTGYPGLSARYLLEQILREEPATLVYALVQAKHAADAEAHVQSLSATVRHRVRLFDGDPTHMDLGLSGEEFRRLAREVDCIHHCAQVTYLGAERRLAERGNVAATREVLELARACEHLRCLVHHSTAFVAGDRTGVVLEAELNEGQKFHNTLEETKAQAETIMRRAMAHLPIAIVRPTHVVGDTQTGAVDRLEGAYLLLSLVISSPADFPLLLPGRGDTPLQVVPVDYVARAAHAIGRDSRAIGQTFHLVDPHPLTVQQVVELVSSRLGRRPQRSFLPANLTKLLLHTPGLERFAGSPRLFFDQLFTTVTYDARNADALLREISITCPPLASYLDKLVDFVQRQQQQRKEQRALTG